MNILFALTYYHPHVSGLTVYVQRLAEALAVRGHTVTVLTSQYDHKLLRSERLNNVHVVRVPVAARVSKGGLMPSYLGIALPLMNKHDIVAINLPNTPFEALFLPALARFVVRRPIVATYHCDVQLPDGLFNRVVDRIVFISNMVAGQLVDKVIAYTSDYARHSHVLRRFPHKRIVIAPPVIVPPHDAEAAEQFRHQHAPNGEPLIGFAARFATEKGVEYMLKALPAVQAAVPGAKVLFAGDYQNVIGEETYRRRLAPLLERAGSDWQFLGVLDPRMMEAFYSSCAVTVLPSINRTESFGLVQVESMLCGTPVVASAMPGVRVPIGRTGMGRTVPVGDAAALAEAVIDVINQRESYVKPRISVERAFSFEGTVRGYEELFGGLVAASQAGRSAKTPGKVEIKDPARPVGAVPRDYLREHLRDLPAFRALIRGIECRLFAQAGPLPGPVLDLGCGDGHFAALAFATPLFAGIDIDAASLGEAEARGAYDHLLVSSATTLPFADNSFNSVIANCAIEHIPDIEAVLRETSRVLRPGGRFVFGVPSHLFSRMLLGSTMARRLGFPGLGRAYGKWFNRHAQHYHTDSPAIWQERLKRHGITVEHWEYYLSPAATRAFDLAHYLGVPRLISRKLTGKWVPITLPLVNSLFDRWLRPYYEAGPPQLGSCIFFHARKTAGE